MSKNNTVTLLGNFDGVHLGHQALISAGKALAEREGLTLTAWTFDAFFAPAITGPDTRAALLKHYGVERVIFEDFEKVKDYSPELFVEKILLNTLNTSVCVCGYNYSFGRDGVGNAELLKKLCEERGIKVVIVDKVGINGSEISSSAIRCLLREGKVGEAAALMGRRYFCTGVVKRGAGKGRTVGMPTLNFYFGKDVALPKNGVYATVTCLENGEKHPSVTNIGYRPTVGDDRGLSVETHIPDFESDLYGQEIKVEFLSFLREEKKFPSLSEVFEQVKTDAETAKEIFLKETSERKE